MKPYYQDSAVTIYHGDCREVLSILKIVDCVITDPPYGVNLGKHGGANDKRTRELRKRGYASYDDTPENYAALIAPIIRACVETTPRAAVFGCAPNIWQLPPPDALGGVYIPAANGRSPWGFQNLAPVLFYGGAPNLHLGAKHTTIRGQGESTRSEHPCPKPLAWMSWLVGLCSLPNETILDPFMGSGTTLRAAKDLNRRAIGIELEEKYCEIAAKRMRQEVLAFG